MSVAFGKPSFSLLTWSRCLLAVLPGLVAAVAPCPWLGWEQAAPPRGNLKSGFWLWQWLLRARAMRGAAVCSCVPS